MKRNVLLGLVLFLSFTVSKGFSQVALESSPYVQDFSGIGTALPDGFQVRLSSTASSFGTAATPTLAATAWNSTSGAFKNFASATGLTSTATVAAQAGSTNRALGIRQTGGTGFDPGSAFVFQAANTTGKTDFVLSFKLQSLDVTSTRTTTWTIDYAFGSAPTVFTPLPSASITGDLTTSAAFKNTDITADFSNILNNQGDVVTIRIVALGGSVGSGSRPSSAIDDFTLTYNSGPSTTPTITINNNAASSLVFPSTNINDTSAALTYNVKGENLTQPVQIAAAAGFVLSTDSVVFSTSLSIPFADVVANKKIYVAFAPTVVGTLNGTVVNASTGATSKSIAVSGQGIDSTNLFFDFNSCVNTGAPGSGFVPYSVTGAQVWNCTTFGSNGTNGVNINGFATTAQNNEDWLISPPLKFGSYTLPVLSFLSRAEFSGPGLELYISTNYSGTGDPNAATWTALNGNFPAMGSNVWTLSDNINLSAYKSFPQAYIAFKYTSSTSLGAARWTIDSVSVANRTNLLSVSPAALNFGSAVAGSNTVAQMVNLQAIGYGDITVTAPANYQISTDNTTFTNAVVVPQATAAAGTVLYVRFSPTVKALTLEGQLVLTGAGLTNPAVSLSGSSYPKSETLDIACYNMSFFGSNATSNPTPAQTATQIANITTVYKRLDADIIGFEEMSSDAALETLKSNLPGYQAIVSNRWSYSFAAPDPSSTLPPQKIGFMYNTATTTLVSSRVMFEGLYDSVRLGTSTRLNNYPTGAGVSPSSFWASGRLPFMATFNTTVGGITKQVRVVVVHGKATGDETSFKRRQFDAKLLKDSLEAYYPNDAYFVVGDYNDRIVSSIYSGSPVTPYDAFRNTATDTVLTYALDAAAKSSFLGSGAEPGMIDHITVSNELAGSYIPGSAAIEPANTYISSYNATTASDHLPVFARFSFEGTLPISLLEFGANLSGAAVATYWTTSSELNSSHFIVQRSNDGINFAPIGQVKAAGTSNTNTKYSFTDPMPAKGINYYRLQQVDVDGRTVASKIIPVMFNGESFTLNIYPNPVSNFIKINSTSRAIDLSAKVISIDGRVITNAYGNITNINQQLNGKLSVLKPGVYMLQVANATEKYTVKFVKQ